MRLTELDERRFYEKVSLPNDDGCQLWRAGLDHGGYGYFRLNQKLVKAHRVAWLLAHGKLDDLPLDHLCKVRSCVAIAHLESVTQALNNQRAAERSTHCRAGLHRWDDQIALTSEGIRRCRPCRNTRNRSQYKRKGTE